jgi:hypothetical protein
MIWLSSDTRAAGCLAAAPVSECKDSNEALTPLNERISAVLVGRSSEAAFAGGNAERGDIAQAGVAGLVDEISLASFSLPFNGFDPTFQLPSSHYPHSTASPRILKMSGTDNNPRKRKAETRERQDGGDKRAKVSSFLRATVKTPPVLAVPFSSCSSCSELHHADLRPQGKRTWDMPRRGGIQSRAIKPGDAGIWATCAMKKEAKSVSDLRDLFQEVSRTLTLHYERVVLLVMLISHSTLLRCMGRLSPTERLQKTALTPKGATLKLR